MIANITEEMCDNLEGQQGVLYTRYREKGYSLYSALNLALLFGQTRAEQSPIGMLEFMITDPEQYIRTHPSALLAWNDFHSPGVLKDAAKEVSELGI